MVFMEPSSLSDIPTRIRERYDQLSRTQQRIADYVLEHTNEVCFQSLKETAAAANTTEATVLKFCGVIGFDGFLHFKRELQDHVKQMMSPNEKLGATLRLTQSAPQFYQRIIETERQSLNLTYNATTPENLERFVSELRRARRIYVAGHHISDLVARYLLLRLRRIGMEVHQVDILDTYEIEQAAVHAEKEDLFVVISFPHYFPKTRALVEYLHIVGAKMICITDRYSSPIAENAAAVLVCNSDDELFYNSITSAISLVNLIASWLVLSDPECFEAYRAKSDQFHGIYHESEARRWEDSGDVY